MPPLYVSDLDGTLLSNDATLSEFSRTTLQSLIDDGMPFTVASARSVVSMGMFLAGLRLPLPVIEMNGAFLSDLKTGRHEIVHSLDSSVASEIYHLLPQFGCVPFVSTFNGMEDCVHYGDVTNGGMDWYLTDRLTKRDRRWRKSYDLRAALREQVVCLTIIGDSHVLADLHAVVKERWDTHISSHYFENLYSPGWYWLTIHDRRATKDQAIQALMDAYGLQGRELVVFGDENNDLSMFRMADRAVAVANATGQLKEHATQVIGANQEDSVVKYLLTEWEGQRTQSR